MQPTVRFAAFFVLVLCVCFEIGEDFVEFLLCCRQSAAAKGKEYAGTTGTFGKGVDIAVFAADGREDCLQFRYGFIICEVFVVFHISLLYNRIFRSTFRECCGYHVAFLKRGGIGDGMAVDSRYGISAS